MQMRARPGNLYARDMGDESSRPRLAELLVDYLLLRTSLDDVARFAVHHLLDRLHVWHVSIYSCSPEGQLRRVGTFGLTSPAQMINLEGRNCFTDTAFTDSLRLGEPCSTFPLPDWSDDDPRLVRDEQLPGGPQLLWPLAIPARAIGLLQVSFLHVPDPAQAEQDVSDIAPVLTLLTMHASPPEDFDDHRAHPATAATDAERVPTRLSVRQVRILELMAEGMTNDQIAHKIAFSASTVRQESMAIYRFLDVASRADAVIEARRRGLLPGLPVEPSLTSTRYA